MGNRFYNEILRKAHVRFTQTWGNVPGNGRYWKRQLSKARRRYVKQMLRYDAAKSRQASRAKSTGRDGKLRPLAIKRLYFNRSENFIRVFVWPDGDCIRTVSGGLTDIACWNRRQKYLTDREEEAIRVLPKRIGDIHLKNHYGSGTYAHEMQHFVQEWQRIVRPKDEEYLPTLVSEMDNEFWAWTWERSTVTAEIKHERIT